MTLEPVLFVPDAHHPFADMKAWALLLKVGKALKPKHLVCIGDFMDCVSISSHSKDPARKALLSEELDYANLRLDELDALGAANKKMILGNHEHRNDRYVADRAPEYSGLVTLPDRLRLKDRGWSCTPYKKATKLGKVFLTHDVGAAGRNATFKALDTFQHSVVTGHAHRMQYVVEGNATGEQKLSAQFGWLGDVAHISYMHEFNAKRSWALGFGVGHLDAKSGVCYIVPVPIVRVGKAHTCVVNGAYYEVR